MLSTRSWRARAALVALLALVLVQATACEPRKHLSISTVTDAFRDSSRGTKATCEHGDLPFRDLTVDYLYPSEPGLYPLVVFAHGWNSDPAFYGSFLGDLASAGYVVAAPHFPVEKPNPCAYTTDLGPQAGDISAVITHVFAGASPASGSTHTGAFAGVVGHSDGALTVGLMSHVPGYHDARVGAYAEVSGAIPAGYPRAPNAAAVLAINGWSDPINSRWFADQYYDASVAPRGELLVNGDHTSILNGEDPITWATRDAIAAFFDRFLRLDQDATIRFAVATGQGISSRTEGW